MVPEWTDEERLDIAKEKVYARYNDRNYVSAEYMDWHTYDIVQDAEIEYDPLDPMQRSVWFDSWEIYALIVNQPTEIDVVATITVYNEFYEPLTESITFTITIEPKEEITVRETLFGVIGEYYKTRGIIQYLFPEYFMIIKDETGLIYVELPGNEYLPINDMEVGSEVLVLGMRAHYEYEDYVPVINQVKDIMVTSSGHTINPMVVPMGVNDIINLDYLDPDTFNQYIVFEGTVIFSGNFWYPSYDIREEGYLDETYDLQMWGDDETSFNATMNGLVGQKIRVYGYLIGYEYVYQAFDWHIKVTHYELVNE
jgi:hypothetical protein